MNSILMMTAFGSHLLAMHPVWMATLFVTGVGLLAGIGLVIASYFFAVKENPLVGELTDCLPGANCGACGYSGCAGYATALAEGKEANTTLCSPGGGKVAKAVANLLGQEAGEVQSLCAQVLCQGDCHHMQKSFAYTGLSTCQAMALVNKGPGACDFGCLGQGDCVRACPFGAISIVDELAVIHSDLCVGCKKCVAVCPNKLIKMFPRQQKKAAVYCNNQDKGMLAKKACQTACIACSACVRTCPVQAIEMDHNHAVIATEKCIGCMQCVGKCPTSAILPQWLPAAPVHSAE